MSFTSHIFNASLQRHTYTCTLSHTHRHIQTHTDTHRHTQTHTHTHTHTETHIETHTDTHRLTHTQTHTESRTRGLQTFWWAGEWDREMTAGRIWNPGPRWRSSPYLVYPLLCLRHSSPGLWIFIWLIWWCWVAKSFANKHSVCCIPYIFKI